MKARQIQQILISVVSAAIKVVVILWLINFLYNKTLEAYDFGYRVFTQPAVSPAPGRDISVAITDGKTEKEIASILAEKGLVNDELLCYVQILASEYKDLIEPGVYTLNTSMTTEEMMYAMSPSAWPSEEEE
ncbi:MAG: aminodeoxychorismate lyase [Lachnospiraceae bacterium]|nr:aminodeoxychorismate lyase [Lachnospiraceae bacterium]